MTGFRGDWKATGSVRKLLSPSPGICCDTPQQRGDRPGSPQVALLQLPVAVGAVGVDPAPADHEISGHIFMCQREHLRIVARSDMQDREE